MKYLSLVGLIKVNGIINNSPDSISEKLNIIKKAIADIQKDNLSCHYGAILDDFLHRIINSEGDNRYSEVFLAIDLIDTAIVEGVLWEGNLVSLQENNLPLKKTVLFLVSTLIYIKTDFYYVNMLKSRLLLMAAANPEITFNAFMDQLTETAEKSGIAFDKFICGFKKKIVFEILEECLYNIGLSGNSQKLQDYWEKTGTLIDKMPVGYAKEVKSFIKNLSRDENIRHWVMDVV